MKSTPNASKDLKSAEAANAIGAAEAAKADRHSTERYAAKRAIPAICAIYGIVGATQFVASTFIALYVNELPFSNSFEIGLVMALGYLVTGVAQTVWGNLADRSKTKNRCLLATLVGLALTPWLFVPFTHQSYATLLPCVVALNMFQLVPQMLVDTIVVENVAKYNIRFGSVKGFASGGAAGIAFVLFVLNFFVSVSSRTGLAAMSIISAAALPLLFYLPPTRGHAYGKGGSRMQEIRLLFRNRRYTLLLFFGLFHFTCTSAFNTFFAVYYTSARSEGGLGASLGLYSLYFAICITAEAALILLGSRAIARVNVYYVFLLAPAGGVFRALATAFAPNPYLLLLCFVFQALMFGPLWSRVAPYIGSIMRDEARATGQAVWSIVIMGLGPVLGSLLGGAVSSALGMRSLFVAIAAVHAAIVAVFWFLFRGQRARDLREGFYSEGAPEATAAAEKTL